MILWHDFILFLISFLAVFLSEIFLHSCSGLTIPFCFPRLLVSSSPLALRPRFFRAAVSRRVQARHQDVDASPGPDCAPRESDGDGTRVEFVRLSSAVPVCVSVGATRHFHEPSFPLIDDALTFHFSLGPFVIYSPCSLFLSQPESASLSSPQLRPNAGNKSAPLASMALDSSGMRADE